MNLKLILTGIGGQGVVFATKVLSEAALDLGYDVIGCETNGMSRRGASVISHLKLGNHLSPLVRQGTADLLLALDMTEAYRTLPFLKPGGACFINGKVGQIGNLSYNGLDESVASFLEKHHITCRIIDADGMAMDLGSPPSANLVLIGTMLSHPGIPFTFDHMRATVERVSPARFRPVNLRALAAGYEYVVKSRNTTYHTW